MSAQLGVGMDGAPPRAAMFGWEGDAGRGAGTLCGSHGRRGKRGGRWVSAYWTILQFVAEA